MQADQGILYKEVLKEAGNLAMQQIATLQPIDLIMITRQKLRSI